MATDSQQSGEIKITVVVNGSGMERTYKVNDGVLNLRGGEIHIDSSMEIADGLLGVGLLTDYFAAFTHWFSWLRKPSVQIFIESTIVGPALTAAVKAIVENVSQQIKNSRDKKLKKAKIQLFGPDGKEIDLER